MDLILRQPSLASRIHQHSLGYAGSIALSLAAISAVSTLSTGCASTEERPRTEDDARQIAPLPACLVELPSGGTAGVVKSLREEQIWSLVYPDYDSRRHALPAEATPCTRRPVLRDKALAGGRATPVVQEGDISLGSGGDRLKVAWLRSMTFDDGSSGGALALIRSYESSAEVYAVGAFRGQPKTLFTIERVGKEIVVVAQDDGCTKRKPRAPCQTLVSVYHPRLGVLDRLAEIGQERITYATDSEPGVRGAVEYRLSSSIQYVDGGIRVLEQILVRDEQGREVRRAELERAFTFAPDSSMVVDEDSLWSHVPAATKAKSSSN